MADKRPCITVCDAPQVDDLIESFPDMIHSVDAEGNIVYVNRMATELLGYPAAELLGMNIRTLYPPEILDAVARGFSEVKQEGGKRVESLLLAQDGTRIPVELRTIVLRDSQGTFTRTFTVSRDLRPLKELQESLIHAGRLAAIGELAAGIVHDLNNPLTAVILASAILKRQAGSPQASADDLRRQTAAYCETISDSASVMESLTTRLRDFARGVKEQHTPVDLFEPINDARAILAHKFRHGNVRVTCPVPQARHWVLGDRNQLQQVFLNLFSNACDAMAGQATSDLQIGISAETVAGTRYWSCAVTDTGTGIPPELQTKVFQSFFTTKPRGKGTGLGLSLSRTIVKEHNGDLRLRSEPGKGTTFFALLPALPEPEPSRPAV